MSEQTAPQGFKASLERRVLLQGDGTYLIRPFRRLSAAVYEVDRATKDRWIRSQQISGWAGCGMGLIGLASVVLFVNGDSSARPLSLVLLVLLNLGVAAAVVAAGTAAAAFVIFRHAERVPEERWTSPVIAVAPERPSSRGWALVRALGNVLIIVPGIWGLTAGVAADHFWSVVGLVLVFAASLLANLLKIFRYAARRVRMMESAVFALFLTWIITSAPASLWPIDIVVGIFGVLTVSDAVGRWRAGPN